MKKIVLFSIFCFLGSQAICQDIGNIGSPYEDFGIPDIGPIDVGPIDMYKPASYYQLNCYSEDAGFSIEFKLERDRHDDKYKMLYDVIIRDEISFNPFDRLGAHCDYRDCGANLRDKATYYGTSIFYKIGKPLSIEILVPRSAYTKRKKKSIDVRIRERTMYFSNLKDLGLDGFVTYFCEAK